MLWTTCKDSCGSHRWKGYVYTWQCSLGNAPWELRDSFEESPKCNLSTEAKCYWFTAVVMLSRIKCCLYSIDKLLHVRKLGLCPFYFFLMQEIEKGTVFHQRFGLFSPMQCHRGKENRFSCYATDAGIQSTSWHLLALAHVGPAVDKWPLMAGRSPWNWV